MSKAQQIKKSLLILSQETSTSKDPNSVNFGKNVAVVAASIDKISKIPESERTPSQRAALKALESWQNNPKEYAYGSSIPARYGMGALNPNDDPSKSGDLKCNRFVAEIAALSGSPFPIRGTNPWNKTPVSAEDLYNKSSIPCMSNINDPKDAKIGDIICFPGHVGIYLGNGLYISARQGGTYGNQVEDGVQISRVDWNQNPKFRRLDGKVATLNNSDNQVAANSDSSLYSYTNIGKNSDLKSINSSDHEQPKEIYSKSSESDQTKDQLEAINKLIASKFSIDPGDPKYKEILPEVLKEIEKSNSEINVNAIANLAGVSMQAQLVPS